MESIELIRLNLENSARRVLAGVEDMREHGTVFPTAKGGAHTLWVLGHLAYTEGLVIRRLMLGEDHPRAGWAELFDGDDVLGDAGAYPPFDEVLTACREARAHTLERLESLTEADLDRASATVPTGFESEFGTYRSCLQFMSDHWYMHRGQLADARRASGIDRMWV